MCGIGSCALKWCWGQRIILQGTRLGGGNGRWSTNERRADEIWGMGALRRSRMSVQAGLWFFDGGRRSCFSTPSWRRRHRIWTDGCGEQYLGSLGMIYRPFIRPKNQLETSVHNRTWKRGDVGRRWTIALT